MTTPATVSNAIDQNARGPKSVRVGGESVEQHPIADQIAADQYAKGQTAATLQMGTHSAISRAIQATDCAPPSRSAKARAT
jgi:hypothetical protein